MTHELRCSPRDYADAVTLPNKRAVSFRTPAAVRGAGLIVAVQGVAALVVAAALVVRGLAGADQRVVNSLGTAIWFVLVGVAVIAAGCALMVGKRWGRGLAVFTQLLLLPVAWYLVVSSNQLPFGFPLGIVAMTVLVLLFSPPAVRWSAGADQRSLACEANRRADSQYQ
ncbi:integral membrane protein [Mycobacterium lepromatosis]|uniref:Integral membrane protein n=1 Tax=Mycobacterium lepromatosis TaxID=480418 RepID=A0A0F4ERP1_9MYCO|nr:integral membrane protein [Mycobacterium lepromatosis]